MLSFSGKSTIASSSVSEKSPLISHTDTADTTNSSNININESHNKHKISFSQLRPFLKIAIPYFRYNRSGIL